MNEEAKRMLDRIKALEAEVAELSRKVSEPKLQQVTLPLDLASAQVIKDALVQAGFTYP